MDYSNHSNLYGEQRIIAAADRGLFRSLMLPFEVLHRQTWWAPWEMERAAPSRSR